MKRITTIICCVALMILGVATAFQNYNFPSNKIAMAQTPPHMPLVTLPTQTTRLLSEAPNTDPTIKDSVRIVDSVRWETKIRWKTRYKNVADRTAAREEGKHLLAANPDSLKENPSITSAMVREEQTTDSVGVSKTPSVQLLIHGRTVYSTNDNHSAEEGL